MLVSMTRTLFPGTTRREVSFDGLVLGTRRGRARAVNTGAEKGVFPERKAEQSASLHLQHFEFFDLILVLITLVRIRVSEFPFNVIRPRTPTPSFLLLTVKDAALREANVMGEYRLESVVWSIEGHVYGHGG